MAAHSESRPSIPNQTRPSSSSARSGEGWTPYASGADSAASDTDEERAAIMPPPSSGTERAASVTSQQTNDLLESISTLNERVKDGASKEAIVDTVKRFARTMQNKVAKLGGVAPPRDVAAQSSDVATSRFSMPARLSLSNSLDGYRPDRDVVAPISVRPNAMELLWICGDCGEHYPRARECPEECSSCGAPKQHFYAPIED
jgi:rubrerythrin